MLQRNWLDRFVRQIGNVGQAARLTDSSLTAAGGARALRGASPFACKRRRQSKHASRALSGESLEVRQVMTATPIAGLSDEFNDAATLASWNEIAQVEGWGAKGMQLNELSINASQPGRMVIEPHTGGWYEDYRGALTFKEVSGDFVVTTRVRITDRDNVGGSDADNIPNDSQYSLGGLMIRTPRAITNGLADWRPGNRQDDGTNNGENYVFLSMGFTTGARNFSFEVKTTRNSLSRLETTALGQTPDEVELQIARIGTSVITLYRLDGQTNWTVHRRYSRPDMPATMQVGMVAYTDWDKMAGITPPVHNTNVLAPGQFPSDPTPSQPFNPDITAAYDFTRFSRVDVPVALQGVNLATAASDQQLLSFLGDNAVIDPNGSGDGGGGGDNGGGGGTDPQPEQVTRVGSNLSGLVDWDPAWVFKDAFNRARPWGTRAVNVATGEATWQFFLGEGPTLQVDEHGWVTSLPTWQHSNGNTYQQQATTVIFTDGANQPAGVYTAEWDGEGELLMPFVTETGTTPTGRHFARINMPFNAHFAMDIASTNPANPIRNIDLWMPDYNGESFVGDVWQPGANESPFHPLLIDRLDELDTLRFMDFMNTNNSDVVSWADRRELSDATQSDGDLVEYFHTNGIAPEYLVELANEVGANAWFNMPHQANDDFVRQFATLVRDSLDPDLKVYVEWSNELWNAQFPVNQWLQQQVGLPENAGLDFFQLAGREIRRDFDIWSEVFEGQEDRLVRVVAGQQANSWLTEQILINVAGRVDAISCTAYAGISYDMALGYTSQTTADDIINDLLNASIPWASARLQEHAQLLQEFETSLGRDLQFVTYESGSHVFGAPNPFLQSPALNAALTAMHSPRMYDVYQTLLGEVHEAGVDLYNEFNFTSHDGANFFGTYGLLHDMTTPLSEAHQFRSLLDFAAAQAGGDNGGGDTDPPPTENHAPVFNAVADQSVNEGATLNFSVSATDEDAGQSLTYSLSDDAPDGMTINAQTGAISWTPSDASGSDLFLVTVIATDNGSPSMSEETTVAISVENVAPTVSISGPSDVMRGQSVQFTLTANDPSAADLAAGFTFDIDWNGDGTVDQTVVGPSGMTVSRSFDVNGTYNVSVTATDKDDATSAAAQQVVRAISTGLVTDPVDPTRTALMILGTGSNDVIQVLTTATAGRVQVKVNNRIAGAFSPTGRIIINGFAGNDSIQLDSRISLPAEIDGGNGNDTVYGAAGNDILLGGAGDDSLLGGGGRDILIGGTGRDAINGGSGEDLLIGGTTSHQTGALRNVMAEWASTRTFAQRQSNLSRVGAGLLTLNPGSTVLDDAITDEIWGGGNPDWLFARLEGATVDLLRDRVSTDSVTRL